MTSKLEMEQQQTLRPELWSRLPQVLVHNIIEKVLVSLPFSRLLRFCAARREWNDFLLSTQLYLLYMHMGHLIAFNPRRGMWESVSLEFCRIGGRKFQHLAVSNEGLLCLSTTGYVDGELMVCNPLTHACAMPVSSARQNDPQSTLYGRLYLRGLRALSRAFVLQRVPREYRQLAKDYQVSMSVNPDTGTFKIYEIYIMKAAHPPFKANLLFDRITLTYDSSTSLWKRVTDVSDSICFLPSKPTLSSRRNLHFSTIDKLGVFRILCYEVDREQWSILECQEGTYGSQIETSDGDVTGAYTTYFLVRGTEDSITREGNHSYRVVRRAKLFTDEDRMHVLRGIEPSGINCKTCKGYFLRDRDAIFSVFFLRLTPASPLLVKMWGHNHEEDSIALTSWEEWKVPNYGPGFPSAEDFQFFRPSFVVPNNLA